MTRWNENQILELLESMNKTSDKIIEILNRIEEKLEKKYLKNEFFPEKIFFFLLDTSLVK